MTLKLRHTTGIQDKDALNDFETIPTPRRRPLRFSLRLMVLCNALSLTVHASVMLWLANSPVAPAAPRAGRLASTPDGSPREVSVAILMPKTKVAQPGRSMPSDRPAQPHDNARTGQARDQPDKPIVEQLLDRSDQSESITQQLTPLQTPADPQNPTDAPSPDARVADASAAARTNDSQPGTQSTTPAGATHQPDAAGVDVSAPALAEQVRELVVQVALPALAQLMQPTDKQLANAQPPTGQPAQPATLTSASEPLASVEPVKPVQSLEPIASTNPVDPDAPDAPADAASPPTTAAHDQAEQTLPDAISTAVVYDELSVDQRVEFDRKALPTLSYKSRQFGDKGTIAILVTVDADGTLLSYEVIDDAGQPRLLASAITALEDSTFHPAQIDGQTVRSKRLIKYAF